MRARQILASTAAFLIAALPYEAAFAQEAGPSGYDRQANVSVRDKPRPDYDPMGLRFGGFDAHAALGVDVGSNDNVFAVEAGEQSDVIASTSENVSLASHWSRHSLAFSGGAVQAHHQDFTQDDTQDHFLRADARADLFRASSAGIGVSTAEQHEDRANPDAPDGTDEPVQFKRNEAYGYVRHVFNRFRVTGRYSQTEYDYEDATFLGGNPLDMDYRDYKETVANGRVEVAMTPRIALLADAASNVRRYDEAPSRNSNGRVYTVGANFDITDLVRGEVSVGRFDQDYDDEAIGDVSGSAYAARIDWFPTQMTTAHFNARRAVEESSVDGASFLHTEAGVRVDHELLRNVLLTAGVRAGKRDYEGIVRKDDQVSADLGAEYLLNRRVRVRAGYAYDHNQSTEPGEDFIVNRVYVGVAFHL